MEQRKKYFDELKVLPKITHPADTILCYVTQVLRKIVAVALSTFGAEDTKETATFCTQMDSWFDCFNKCNLEEADRKKKHFLQPYRDSSDTRIDWLEKGFF